MKRWIRTGLAALACVVGARSAPAADVPACDFDRVDHAKPDACLALPPTLGKKATIEKIAAEAKAATPRKSLAAIWAWIDSHLKYDANAAYAWRDVDKLLADGTYGGCADHAELFGAIARGCGIPTIWVKTMDCAWIRNYVRDHDENRTWSGHVFLEVFLEGKWRLLDATQGEIYDAYEPKQRLLPGDRWAYDKGADPFALVLSPRWEDWKQQTRTQFAKFDVAQLPVDGAVPLSGRVYVAANEPMWDWTAARVKALGMRCGRSGNTGFDEWMPGAKTGWLVVVCLADRVPLPDAYRGLLPIAVAEIAPALKKDAVVVRRKTAADGTKVVLVAGRDQDALKTAIETLKIDD